MKSQVLNRVGWCFCVPALLLGIYVGGYVLCTEVHPVLGYSFTAVDASGSCTLTALKYRSAPEAMRVIFYPAQWLDTQFVRQNIVFPEDINP